MPPSSYFTRLKNVFQHKIQRSISGQEGGFQGSLEVLAGQGKYLFGNSRLFHSIPFTAISDLHVLVRPSTVFAARSDLQSVNQRRNISVVGAVSRAFSVPSVSGPSFQVCGYHAERLFSNPSDSSIVLIGCCVEKKSMAASGSSAVFRNFCVDNTNFRSTHLLTPLINGCSYKRNRRSDCSVKVSMNMRKGEQPNKNLVHGDLIYDVTRRMFNFNSFSETGFKGFHSSSSSCFSTGTAPDMSLDNSVREDGLANSEVASEQKIPVDRILKLLSGSCYLPHPAKEETGGEDAHFICVDEQAIGVADGVGGWAEHGIDAGIYSRELMSNSVSAVHEEPKGSVDPARVLEKAHSSTKAEGSSTACIIALTDKGLHAINLGDSGFMVVRDGCTTFRSPVQQHDFNFTYQLESGYNGDLPSSGEVFTIPVAPGDVIIAGTDGLFDNLYNNEVTAVVVHAIRAGLGPQVAAQKIAALARERALDDNRQTPFSTAAQDAGFRYYGGKLDDITVVVSYITSSGNDNNSLSTASNSC